MTEQEQIKAIAELDRWLDVKEYTYTYTYAGESGDLKQLQGRHPTDLGRLQTPLNYPHSLDAIVPVIRNQPFHILQMISVKLFGMNVEFLYLATPSQLCEALLRATGKWKD